MAIQTIESNAPLLAVNTNIDATQARLEANPLTASLAVAFSDFRAQRWTPVFLQELSLQTAMAQAKARIQHTDVVLNGLVKKLDAALLVITKGDTTALLYQQFFGAQRPYEVTAPLLGPQLETMRGWIDLLLTSPHASLQAIGAEIEAAVQAADAAVAQKVTAENAITKFETTGERVQMIEAFNALRKSTFGKLGEIQHQNPELQNGFPDTFFLHEVRRRDDKLSAEQIQAKIDAVQADLGEWQKKLAAAQVKEKAAEDAKAAQAAKAAELAAKKKQADALAAEIKQLESDLST